MDTRFPNHVAIIMDGNGRWAKAHGVPRVMGHNAGMEAMKQIISRASDLGIKNLTVYAFSTENWKRSVEEVSGIFKLIIKYVKSELKELKEKNVHINIIGKYDALPADSVASLNELAEGTASGDGMNFNVCLNYGGRDEITRAVNEIIKRRFDSLYLDPDSKDAVNPSSLDIEAVTEEEIARYLYTGSEHFDIPDPDLIIRTSGELRMSNFLVWQSAYSELMFTDTLWPDFTPDEFEDMVRSYGNRERRFGGRNE